MPSSCATAVPSTALHRHSAASGRLFSYIMRAMDLSDSVLRDFLVDAGLVSRRQIEALPEDKSLSRALIDGGVLSEDEVRRAAAHALGVPFVVLTEDDISTDALSLLPEPLCRAHHVAAYRTQGDKLEVAVLDLKDLEALDPLRGALPYKIAPRLTTRDSLRKALLSYQRHLKERFGERLRAEKDPRRLLEALLRHALHQRAQEAHIESSERGLIVRYRHGQSLSDAMLLPNSSLGLVSAIRTLGNVGSRTLPQEGRFKLDLGSGTSVAVRVSSVPLVDGEKLLLRILPESAGARGYTLEGLGLHGQQATLLRAALGERAGMVLVCGALGSGKTTLLYTLLDVVHSPELSLASIEEHVAERLPYVAQTQSNPPALTMAAALRATLRQDPDVVMLDSIGDRDTAALALSAAARGVLVLASIDAPTADAALERLKAWGLSERELSAVSITVETGVVKKLCDKQTRTSRKVERRHLEPLEAHADFAHVLASLKEESATAKDVAWKDIEYPQVTGCSECDKGFRGEVGVFAVFRSGIRGLNLIEDALFKAAAGQTSLSEALRLGESRQS